jgi:iron complex outermembrane receptor protein
MGVSGSYVLSYKIPLLSVPLALRDEDFMNCSGDTCDVAGVRNFANFARSLPQLRVTLPLGWELDGHSAGLTGHFISGYTDDGDSDPTSEEEYRDIDAQVTLDLQYQYRLDEGDGAATTFRIGVQNLLDTEPPEVNAGYGYDVFVHDPRGRILYARLIQEL